MGREPQLTIGIISNICVCDTEHELALCRSAKSNGTLPHEADASLCLTGCRVVCIWTSDVIIDSKIAPPLVLATRSEAT